MATQRGRPDDEELRRHEDNIAGATGVLHTLARWFRFISFFSDEDNQPEFERDYKRSKETLERLRDDEIRRMNEYKRRRRK
jgi:hypothetical protein